MDQLFAPFRQRIQGQLEDALGLPKAPKNLQSAMHYGVFNGGKRIRPILTYMSAEALGLPLAQVDAAAVAIELIHCYSLIHDDLPAMDDDDLRRGNPTVHIQFNEATAILAGDALQTLSFQIIADCPTLTAQQKVELIQLLARASGAEGMVAGQDIDLASEGITISAAELETMHSLKTGALISASVEAAGIIANLPDAKKSELREFGLALGLTFQIADDILDAVGTTEKLGKQQGADEARDKTTFVSAYGLEEANHLLQQLLDKALALLEPMGDKALHLRQTTEFIARRDH